MIRSPPIVSRAHPTRIQLPSDFRCWLALWLPGSASILGPPGCPGDGPRWQWPRPRLRPRVWAWTWGPTSYRGDSILAAFHGIRRLRAAATATWYADKEDKVAGSSINSLDVEWFQADKSKVKLWIKGKPSSWLWRRFSFLKTNILNSNIC